MNSRTQYKTFLFNEARRLADVNERSIKKIIMQNNPRANAYIIAYSLEINKLFPGNSLLSNKLNKEIIFIKLGQKSQYSSDIEKAKWFSESNKSRIEQKKVIASYEIKNLYFICSKLQINYSQAYRFFINKEFKALSLSNALSVALANKQLNEEGKIKLNK